MYVDFNELPKNSKVWIYQSTRKFNDDEMLKINELLISFVQTWKDHGKNVTGSFQIKYNQFIIIALDNNERNVPGCVIDASIRVLREIENLYQVDLLNKFNTTYRENGSINVVKLIEFQKLVKESKINLDTIVFNGMVSTIQEFESLWEVPVTKSWHQRYFN
ncbi:MAG TPA: ABC transporter ATPase [Flavobacteriaceae bacterium]|nr:ABC transporter ATPase [Flavobacteriaceae bacterium]